MNIPEFSAECSLYKSSKTYVATPNYAAAGNAVIPALPVFRFCKNARAWVGHRRHLMRRVRDVCDQVQQNFLLV